VARGEPDLSTTTRQDLRDLLLVGLTVASGAADVISYFVLGKTFSAFMTGNIVFLGFAIAKIRGPAVLPVLCALSMFAVGAFLGLRIVTLRTAESGLWARPMSALLMLVAIADAAFLAVSDGRTTDDRNHRCSSRAVLAGDGDTDRCGPITGRAGSFHHSWDFHLGRVRRHFGRVSCEGRDSAPTRGARRVGCGRRRGVDCFCRPLVATPR
jgi:hypothetical protein